jgi:hypothetical protein
MIGIFTAFFTCLFIDFLFRSKIRLLLRGKLHLVVITRIIPIISRALGVSGISTLAVSPFLFESIYTSVANIQKFFRLDLTKERIEEE